MLEGAGLGNHRVDKIGRNALRTAHLHVFPTILSTPPDITTSEFHLLLSKFQAVLSTWFDMYAVSEDTLLADVITWSWLGLYCLPMFAGCCNSADSCSLQ